MKKKKRYPSTMPCPCGSGKKYKDCCKNKDVKYFLDDNTIIKKIPMRDELYEMLLREIEEIKELYGRYPLDNEKILMLTPMYNDDVLLQTMYAFRETGVPENYIYAYHRTNGLIPCKINEELMSDKDIEEFNEFRTEYDELISQEKENGMNSLQYVCYSNNYLERELGEIINIVIKCLNDFIGRHGESNRITKFKMEKEIDYYLFSAIKTIKTLHSIKKLKDEHMTECIYALGRGIFENYMYLCNINSKIGFFENRLLPKVDVENYSFKIKENGQIDYNKVIKNSAPETVKNIYIKLSELKDALEFNEDKEIYDMFYQTACQYVHVDVLSAKNYFATIDPYDEIDPSLIAYLIIIVLSAMLLSQFGKYRESQEQYRKDILYLCKNKLNERLTFCLMLANQDTEHKNEILDLLKKRIETEFGNLK